MHSWQGLFGSQQGRNSILATVSLQNLAPVSMCFLCYTAVVFASQLDFINRSKQVGGASDRFVDAQILKMFDYVFGCFGAS